MAKGRADYYADGDWNAVCYECGRKRKASTLVRHWQGYYVCQEHWEPRHPQDFVRGTKDIQTPEWTQPDNDIFIFVGDRIVLESNTGSGEDADFILTEAAETIEVDKVFAS